MRYSEAKFVVVFCAFWTERFFYIGKGLFGNRWYRKEHCIDRPASTYKPDVWVFRDVLVYC